MDGAESSQCGRTLQWTAEWCGALVEGHQGVSGIRRSLGDGQAIPIEHPIEGSPVHPEDFSGPLFVSAGGCENAPKVLLGQFVERGEGVRSEAGDWFRFVG